MNRKTISAVLALSTAFLAGSLAGPPSAAAPPPQGPAADVSKAVAVVDVGRVLKGYARARELDAAWKADEDAVKARLRQGNEAIEKLELDLSGYDPPFTPEWVAAAARVEGAKAELQRVADLEKRRLLIDRLKNRELVYDDMDRAVRDLAKKKGLQLVLKMLPDSDEVDVDQRVAMWANRGVFYYDEKLDLTEDVILALKSPEAAAGAPTNTENGK